MEHIEHIIVEEVSNICSDNFAFVETFAKDLNLDIDYKNWVQSPLIAGKSTEQKIEYILTTWQNCKGSEATPETLYRTLEELSKRRMIYTKLVHRLRDELFCNKGPSLEEINNTDSSLNQECSPLTPGGSLSNSSSSSRKASNENFTIPMQGIESTLLQGDENDTASATFRQSTQSSTFRQSTQSSTSSEEKSLPSMCRKLWLSIQKYKHNICQFSIVGSLLITILTLAFYLHHSQSLPSENYKENTFDCMDSDILILIGGENKEEKLTKNVEIVLPSFCKSSNDLPQLKQAISNPVASLLGNNHVITCGGCEDPSSCGAQTTSCQVLDLQNKEKGWINSQSLNEPRMYSSFFQLEDGSMCIAGGFSPSSQNKNGKDTVECLRGHDHTWKLRSPLTFPAAHHCMATVGNKIYSTGGKPGEDMSTLNADDPQWKKDGMFQHSRYDHACLGFEVEGSKFILVEGGLTEMEKCAPTEVYDMTNTKVHHPTHCREGATLIRLKEKILLVGGVVNIGDTPYYPREIYEFNQDRWLKDSTLDPWDLVPDLKLPSGRSGHAAVVIKKG